MKKRRSKSISTQPFQAEITGLSHEGRGIASINGKVTFLFGGLPGETAEFTYLKTHGKYDKGAKLSQYGRNTALLINLIVFISELAGVAAYNTCRLCPDIS